MKKFFSEFKTFIMRGNVVDLAVAVIIGGAFQAIVNSFINDLVMPFIGLITGGINFADQFLILKVPEGVEMAAVEAAKTAADATAFIKGYILEDIFVWLICFLTLTLKKQIFNKNLIFP